MDITKLVSEQGLIVEISGRLDTSTAPELEKFIEQNLSQADRLSLDCKNLTYVSSAGLRVLLAVQKKLNEKFVLKNVQELVMEVFEMTGFIDILTIE